MLHQSRRSLDAPPPRLRGHRPAPANLTPS
jgi:hypothetical protein